MYTVTFKDSAGQEIVSRLFQTSKAARAWCRWLAKQRQASMVFLYRGQAGEHLIDQYK